MKHKITIWILFIITTPILAGLYGIVHDFITFSISSEYFTNFKLIQYQIPEYYKTNEWLSIGLVGFLSTWWTGLPIGIILGGYGIWKKDLEINLTLKLKSIGLTLLITILLGAIGFVIGKTLLAPMHISEIFITNSSPNSEMRDALLKIADWPNFIIVGTIHNFSYFGGLIGLLFGWYYQYRKLKTSNNSI
jgi:hypothetical protein